MRKITFAENPVKCFLYVSAGREIAGAGTYNKIFPDLMLSIYKELKQQNEIIFEAEKERNVWELERDDLIGIARFTKKGKLQSKIDRKNEEIDILKIGLSGIAKRYGYKNVQEFYRVYNKSLNAYADYRDKVDDWKKTYGENAQKNESLREWLQNYPKKRTDIPVQKIGRSNDRGAR